MSIIKKPSAFMGLLSVALACGMFGIVGCSNGQAGMPTGDGAASATDTANEDASSSSPVEITAKDVDAYCGMCHFDAIENASISSFNRDTVDKAMVESMVPMESDETIQALADYFSQIEPVEQ